MERVLKIVTLLLLGVAVALYCFTEPVVGTLEDDVRGRINSALSYLGEFLSERGIENKFTAIIQPVSEEARAANVSGDSVGVLPPLSDQRTSNAIKKHIIDIATSSPCATYEWKNRGVAPIGYTQGMALVFANALCHQKRTDVAIASLPTTADSRSDVLAHYGIQTNGGTDSLKATYTMLMGLGPMESSGEHCCGRDTSASNTSAETAEAGLFQTSYNSRVFSPVLPKLFSHWINVFDSDRDKCLLSVFSQGAGCGQGDWANHGSGAGYTFQKLSKECPAFSVEYAAVMIRKSGGSAGHYGPLRRKLVEYRSECAMMFPSIEAFMSSNPNYCQAFP